MISAGELVLIIICIKCSLQQLLVCLSIFSDVFLANQITFQGSALGGFTATGLQHPVQQLSSRLLLLISAFDFEEDFADNTVFRNIHSVGERNCHTFKLVSFHSSPQFFSLVAIQIAVSSTRSTPKNLGRSTMKIRKNSSGFILKDADLKINS